MIEDIFTVANCESLWKRHT